MLKPAGSSPRAPTTSLSPLHLLGGLHVQQVVVAGAKINQQTLKSKNTCMISSHLFTSLLFRGNYCSWIFSHFYTEIEASCLISCCFTHSPDHMDHQLIATTPLLVVCMAWSHAQAQWINDSDSCSWQPVFAVFLNVLWIICLCDCTFLLLWGSSLLQAVHVPVCSVTHLQMSVEAPTS